MRTYLVLAASALLTLSGGAAAAAPAKSGDTLLVSCRQGQCAWIQVDRIQSADPLSQGRLVTLSARSGLSAGQEDSLEDPQISWEDGIRTDRAFCSTSRPAYAFGGEDGQLVVHFLDLFDLGGYQQATARLYLWLCHGLDEAPREAELRSLGYRPGTRNEQVETTDPDLLIRF